MSARSHPSVWAFALVLVSSTTWGAEPSPAEVDAIFADYDRTTSPGCSMAVYRDGEIAYARGYGMANLEYGIANGPASVFRIGSTSKQFTALAIALLAEQGELSLDDDVRRYFPEMPDYGKPVTIDHVVHHTSGLRDYLGLASFADWTRDYSIDEAMRLITRQHELNFVPGTQYLYSNSNYFLLSQIVEKVTGQSLRVWSQAHVFEPLGMRSSHFHDDHTHIVPNRADGYAPDGSGGYRISMTILDMVGDGGVYTTVEDLLRWDRNFYDNRLGGGNALIDRLYTPAVLDDGTPTDYGFGLSVGEHRGVREISHGGAFVGYRAELVRYPERRVSVAVLCNRADADPTSRARRVAELYLGDVPEWQAAEAPIPAEKSSVPQQRDEAALRRVTGDYWNADDMRIRSIVLEDGTLYYDRDSGGRTELAPLRAGGFTMVGMGVPVTVRFEPATGAPQRMIVDVPGDPAVVFEAFQRVVPSAEDLAEVAGSYYSEELDRLQRLSIVDGGLVAEFRAENLPLRPVVRDVFGASGFTIRLERNAEGAIRGLRVDAGRIRNLRYERR